MFPTVLLTFLLASLIICSNGDKLSDRLWSQTAVIRQQALNSNFIQGIKKISLDPEEFGVYNVQDALYFYYVTKCLKLAEEKTTDEPLKGFLHGRAESYERLYTGAFNKWHIKDVSGLQLEPATGNYVNHLFWVAQSMTGYYLVAALIPCSKLWPWLGGEIGVKDKTFGVYTKWAEENLNPGYIGFDKYEKVINDAFDQRLIDENNALQVYNDSMNSEVAFFNSVSPTFDESWKQIDTSDTNDIKNLQ